MIRLRSKIISSAGNQPVAFAQIQIANTTRGTQADESGNFVLDVMPGSLLEIHAIGYYTGRHFVQGNESTITIDPNPVEIGQVTITPDPDPTNPIPSRDWRFAIVIALVAIVLALIYFAQN